MSRKEDVQDLEDEAHSLRCRLDELEGDIANLEDGVECEYCKASYGAAELEAHYRRCPTLKERDAARWIDWTRAAQEWAVA